VERPIQTPRPSGPPVIGRSDIEEDGFALALQADVENVARLAVALFTLREQRPEPLRLPIGVIRA
jgi:hypothetical protein